MYDLSGNPITMDLALLWVLISLRLGFDFHIQLWGIAVDFLRRVRR